MSPVSSGANSRAVEARARKKAQQEEAIREKQLKQDEDYWRDDHKLTNAKLNRKNETQQKAEEQRNRKAENRKLAEEELLHLSGGMKQSSGTTAHKKLNRAEIVARAAMIASKTTQAAQTKTIDEEPLTENPNQALREQMREAKLKGEDLVNVSGLHDALRALNVEETVDRNPERRMKTAFKSYEEQWMPRLREENPTLKRSQLLDMIYKQWKKAPENPMNRVNTTSASTTAATDI